MQEFEHIKVLFVAGFGPIVRNRVAGRQLYGETLDIAFKEPWGQTVTRFLSPEGLLVGLTVTPSMRRS